MIRFRAASAADLIDRAREAPPGSETIDILRRAVVMADRTGDLDGAFEARRELISAAYYGDADVDQVAAFCWCMSMLDAHPGRFQGEVQGESFLWYYKWIVSGMIDFTPVPLAILDALLEDMAGRYRVQGLGSSAVDQLRLTLAMSTSQTDRLEALFTAWDENRELAGSDCTACRQHERVLYRIATGDDERALREAAPLLDGKMRCASKPHDTFAAVLLPCIRLRRGAEAASAFNRGYPMIRQREGFTHAIGRHLLFLAIAGQVDCGLQLLQMHLREALLTRSDLASICFYRGAQALCRRAVLDGRTTVLLSLTPRFEIFERDGIYDVRELAAHFQRRLDPLTNAFDRRSGNSAQAASNSEATALVDEQQSIPVDVVA